METPSKPNIAILALEGYYLDEHAVITRKLWKMKLTLSIKL